MKNVSGRSRSRLLALILATALIAAGCGDDDSPEDSSASTTAPSDVTTDEDADGALGTPDPAEGEPVTVGLITNGAGQGFDTTIDEPVARATIEWLNEYRNGIGGRPVELVVCEDLNDPGQAADCANEMVREGAVAVVYGANGNFDASWRPLSEAGIPTFSFVTGSDDAAKEPNNTFLLANSLTSTIDGPLAIAQERGDDIVSVVAVDVPAATVNFREGRGPRLFEEPGVELDLITAPLGTPDLTPQMTQLVNDNPDGTVLILGNDAFCIAALNGLETAGYSGAITANEGCISDATREAVSSEMLEGIKIPIGIPAFDEQDRGGQLYGAILDEFGEDDIDPTVAEGAFVFIALAGLDVATMELEGDVTPDAVAAAAKSMEWLEVPGMSGRHIRCNGKAEPELPGICSNAVLYASLDSDGIPSDYEVVADDPIPD